MATEPHARDPINHTLVMLRGLDHKLDRLTEIVLRHDTRLGRLERDLGDLRRDVSELKSDIVPLENKFLNQTNDILSVMQRIEERYGSADDTFESDQP